MEETTEVGYLMWTSKDDAVLFVLFLFLNENRQTSGLGLMFIVLVG
jgi:hypothetical protein